MPTRPPLLPLLGALAGALLVALPGTARAEAVRATYSAYARGLNVLNLEADFALTATTYRVNIAFRTAGTVGAMFPGEQVTTVDGRFVAGRPVPRRFDSRGVFRGTPRATLIEYVKGQPLVRALTPPNEEEREPVPEASQAFTVDGVSVMAQLIHQIAATGRCDGTATTFDGRRLSEVTARTVGPEVLPPTDRSSFAGTALRCDFEGRLVAGHRRDADPAATRRPQGGSAWFATVTPGGTPVPVLVSFRAPWLGNASLYLTGPAPSQAPRSPGG